MQRVSQDRADFMRLMRNACGDPIPAGTFNTEKLKIQLKHTSIITRCVFQLNVHNLVFLYFFVTSAIFLYFSLLLSIKFLVVTTSKLVFFLSLTCLCVFFTIVRDSQRQGNGKWRLQRLSLLRDPQWPSG